MSVLRFHECKLACTSESSKRAKRRQQQHTVQESDRRNVRREKGTAGTERRRRVRRAGRMERSSGPAAQGARTGPRHHIQLQAQGEAYRRAQHRKARP